jgi:hypothetical protein
MRTVEKLIEKVSEERKLFIERLTNIPDTQSQWKPAPEIWNLVEITEHLFWAEQGGIFGMWKTLHAIREGRMERVYESVHRDMPIEQIIDLTWRPKEIVPASATPRLGGPLSFWTASLHTLQEILEAFGKDLQDDELRLQAHPHPISGPLDFQQRIEFLAFHLRRHRGQVAELLALNPHCSFLALKC